MARRDFRKASDTEDLQVAVNDALIEGDQPVTVVYSQTSSSGLSPSTSQQGVSYFRRQGAIVRTITARATPSGTNLVVDILGNVGSEAATTNILNNSTKNVTVECTHTASGRKTSINFIVLDVTGGGTGK